MVHDSNQWFMIRASDSWFEQVIHDSNQWFMIRTSDSWFESDINYSNQASNDSNQWFISQINDLLFESVIRIANNMIRIVNIRFILERITDSYREWLISITNDCKSYSKYMIHIANNMIRIMVSETKLIVSQMTWFLSVTK